MVWKAHQFLQLGYICRNLEQAIDYFVDSQGAGPFYAIDFPPNMARYTYRGVPPTGITKNRVAFGYRGPLQFELIETDNPIFDHVRADRDLAFHHCMQMSDRFDADRERYARSGFVTMGTAEAPGVLIHYIDTWKQLGHYTELFDYSRGAEGEHTAMFRMFEVMWSASDGWDGSRRMRPMPDLPG